MKYTDNEIAQEQWKDIFGYDGMYQVSDLGRVRSKKYGRWKMLKPNKNRFGYLMSYLYKDGKPKNISVHRLVAQAFIENNNIFNTEINHINEDKTDNRVSNLEWCDRQYNLTYNDIHHRRKKYNSPKHYNCKRRKLEKLYRPDLSIAENLEIFKANGIECSEKTVRNLRKDLGVVNLENPKYKTLKELYNPDLTYHENIAIFKTKGIECRKWTVWKLRKDLGLVKKYKV